MLTPTCGPTAAQFVTRPSLAAHYQLPSRFFVLPLVSVVSCRVWSPPSGLRPSYTFISITTFVHRYSPHFLYITSLRSRSFYHYAVTRSYVCLGFIAHIIYILLLPSCTRSRQPQHS